MTRVNPSWLKQRAADILQLLGKRLRRSYTTFPSLTGWLESALLLVAVAVICIPVGQATDLLKYAPANDPLLDLLLLGLVAVFVPSLLEETVYRALLLPHPTEQRSQRYRLVSVAISVPLFVLVHPLIAWLFAPDAREMFYDGSFLCLCVVFGVATSLAYLRTGSIWPSVAMHWCVVVAWKLWFGGWIMLGGIT